MIFGNYQPRERPWATGQTRPTQTREPHAAATMSPKPPFRALGTLLVVLTVFATIGGVIALVGSIADGSFTAFMTASVLFGAAITFGLGQVLIFVAERIDHIAKLQEKQTRS